MIKPGTDAHNTWQLERCYDLELPRICSKLGHRNWAEHQPQGRHRCQERHKKGQGRHTPGRTRRTEQGHHMRVRAPRKTGQVQRSLGQVQRTPGQGHRTLGQGRRTLPRQQTHQSFPGEGWRGWRLKLGNIR